MQHYKQACKDIELLSSFTTFPLNQVSKAAVHGGRGREGNTQTRVCIQTAVPFVSRAEVMTVSIHATSGWALVISLYQSVALPAQPKRQGRKGGGNWQLSLPLSVTLSPSFFLPICVSHSHSNSPFVKALSHQCAPIQPVTLSLAPLFSAPRCISNQLKGDEWVSSSCASLPPCRLSACRHAHTDDQQTLPAQRGP